MFRGMGGGLGAHSTWAQFMRADEQARPNLTRDLLRRVAGYARPYALRIAIVLVAIFAQSLIGLVPPLLFRDLIDHALPQKDLDRLNFLALGMIAIPLLNGLIGV